jgi:flagellar hook assembly protein FlgD
MKRITLLFFVTMVSVCLGQTGSVIIKLNDGTNKTYNLSEVREIMVDGIPTSIEEEQITQKIAQSFSLYQNYPNPFNPSTNIRYEIPDAGPVDISIYDIQGRLIRILSKQSQQAGSHSVTWDGRNNSGAMVSSGTYFCSVRFKDSYQTKKLLLIK